MALPSKPLPLLLLTILVSSPPSHQTQEPSIIDRIVKNSAFEFYRKHRSKTGVVYEVPLPSNLSMVSVHATRVRSGSFRRHGASIDEFRISPGLVARPHTKRLLIVRQNLGDLSSVYTLSGFRLVSPVVGLGIFDAAFPSDYPLRILIAVKPIVVDFGFSPDSESRCALFGLDGKTTVWDRESRSRCEVWRQGHFALVTESSGLVQDKNNCSSTKGESEKRSRWKVAVAGVGGGAFGAALLGLVVVAVVKGTKRKREMAEMERRTREEAALRVSMVGHLRVPVAPGSRTAPALDDDFLAPFVV